MYSPRISETNQLYAMKYLMPPKEHSPSKRLNRSYRYPNTLANRNKRFVRGIADLAIEARFLALLSHDNIISLRYVSQGSFEEQFRNHRFGYFLLLDPMFETLANRIDVTYIPQVLNRPKAGFVEAMVHLRRRFPSTMISWRKIQNMRNDADADSSCDQNALLNMWKMLLARRLTVLKDIASALQYMHDECHVVCRDIKPDNIGFYRNPHPECHCGRRVKQRQLSTGMQECTCYDDIPKLFDFGLCKELKSKDLKSHPFHGPEDKLDAYNLPARSGSRRYMAPEVALSLPYNEKADVYSFGILLYQVASLLKPFDEYSFAEHEDEVICRGTRPNVEIPSPKTKLSIAKGSRPSCIKWFTQRSFVESKELLEARTKCVWTEELKKLIVECWQGDMRLRPAMHDVVVRLEDCIQELACVKQKADNIVKSSKEMKRKTVQSKCVAKASRVFVK